MGRGKQCARDYKNWGLGRAVGLEGIEMIQASRIRAKLVLELLPPSLLLALVLWIRRHERWFSLAACVWHRGCIWPHRSAMRHVGFAWWSRQPRIFVPLLRILLARRCWVVVLLISRGILGSKLIRVRAHGVRLAHWGPQVLLGIRVHAAVGTSTRNMM